MTCGATFGRGASTRGGALRARSASRPACGGDCQWNRWACSRVGAPGAGLACGDGTACGGDCLWNRWACSRIGTAGAGLACGEGTACGSGFGRTVSLRGGGN
jgi:hypothetical protein